MLCSWTTSRLEVGGYRRRERHLKRPGGDHDLVGLVGAVGELDEETAAVACPHGLHAAVELDRQLEPLRVVGEVGDDVVAPRVAVGVAWEVEPGQAVVAHGREQPQRVPAAPPRRGRLAGRFEDGEPTVLLGEVVADGQAGLTAADDDDFAPLGAGVSDDPHAVPVTDATDQPSENSSGMASPHGNARPRGPSRARTNPWAAPSAAPLTRPMRAREPRSVS